MNNRLLQLLRDNARAEAKAPFRAEVQGDEATLYVYDVIVSDPCWGGVGAEDFVKALGDLDVGTIHVRFNSPGGEVFAGRAMEQALREKQCRTVAHIDGYAASAASFVALACDEVEIAPGAFIMIHQASTVVWGNAEDLEAMADLLGKLDAALVDTYARETGQDPADILAWVKAETWLSAQEAVDLGFADRIAEDSAKPQGAWNLGAYRNAPKAAAPPAPPAPPEPPMGQTTASAETISQADRDHLYRRLAFVERMGR